MGLPKTYIYSFDNVKVMVCSYSMELFNHLIKHARSSGIIYAADLEIVSHKIYNRTSCNCREVIKDSTKRIESKLKTFERVILPLEMLELDNANAFLFICEVCRSKKKSGSKLRIINATVKNCPNQLQMMKTANKPKNCLLRLYKILDEEIWLSNDLVGRNNSFNGKHLVYKDCYKEIARELAGKGALPGDLSQKCIYSRDNNRCWFDYCRLMDTCIHFKLSAREIADFIKHLAAIDPMQPDPVVCIKSRFNSHQSRSDNEDNSNHTDSNNESSSESKSSSSNSETSSSSMSDLVVTQPRHSNKSRSSLSKHKSESGSKSGRHSRSKICTKQTQTFNRNKNEYICRCRKSQYGSSHGSRLNDLESDNYLWTPEYYGQNTYEGVPPMNDDYPEGNDFYGNCGSNYEYDMNEEMKMNQPYSDAAIEGLSDYRDGNIIPNEDYDQRGYDDYIDDEDIFIQDSYDDCDEPVFCDDNCDSYLCPPRSRYPSQISKQTVFSDRVIPTKTTLFLRHSGKDNTLTRVRSLSQPMTPTKSKSFRLVSNSNNSQDFKTGIFRKLPLKPKCENKHGNTTECSTQTCKDSPTSNDPESVKIKKFASDSFLCVKPILMGSENNSNKTFENFSTNMPEVEEKKYIGEGVQTESPRSDFSHGLTTSLRSSSQQTKFPDTNSLIIPKSINRNREHTKDNSNSYPKLTLKSNLKANSNQPKFVSDKVKQRRNEPSYPHGGNKNSNNHSVSRSASSRNSQIVEIENDVDKISSVLVESDCRSILLFRGGKPSEKLNEKINTSSKSPFFEKESLQSFSVNCKFGMNVNNAIKSVTVSNQGRMEQPNPGVDLYQCSIQGCRNLATGSNYTCPCHDQMSPRESPCSPDRCLSRLSCIVGLNKHILENQQLTQDSSLEMNALHKAIYGPYNDEDCAKALAITSQRLKKNQSLPLQSEYVNNDSQYLLSLSDPNRRFCSHFDLPPSINPGMMTKPLSQPSYSPMKHSKQSLGEVQDLQSRKYYLQETPDVHNIAPLGYQTPLAEQTYPLSSTAIADCRNVALSNYDSQPKMVSSNSFPMNGTYSFSQPEEVIQYGSEFSVVPETLKPEFESTRDDFQNRSSSAVVHEPSKQYKLSQTRVTFNDRPQGLSFLQQPMTPCGRRFPLNLQLCPIPGCTNLTTTNSPPCLCGQYFQDDVDKPDSTFRKPFVESPYVDLETNLSGLKNFGYSNQLSPSTKHSFGFNKASMNTNKVNSQPANCEVIIDGDILASESYPSNTLTPLELQQKSLVQSNILNEMKTVNTDSKNFYQRESNLPNDLSNPQSLENTTTIPMDSMYKNIDGTSSMRHISNHQSWSQSHDAYTPNTYRHSAKSEPDGSIFRSMMSCATKACKNTSTAAGSNVNHIAEIRSSPNIKRGIKHVPENLKNVPGELIGDIDLKISLKSDKSNKNILVNERKFSIQRKFNPKTASKVLSISEVNAYKLPAKSLGSVGFSKIKTNVSKSSTPFNSPTIIKDQQLSDAHKSVVDHSVEQEYNTGTLVEYAINGENSQNETTITQLQEEPKTGFSSIKDGYSHKYNPELSPKEPIMTIHNHSFSPVSVFTTPDNMNSETGQVILVDSPELFIKDKDPKNSSGQSIALSVDSNEYSSYQNQPTVSRDKVQQTPTETEPEIQKLKPRPVGSGAKISDIPPSIKNISMSTPESNISHRNEVRPLDIESHTKESSAYSVIENQNGLSESALNKPSSIVIKNAVHHSNSIEPNVRPHGEDPESFRGKHKSSKTTSIFQTVNKCCMPNVENESVYSLKGLYPSVPHEDIHLGNELFENPSLLDYEDRISKHSKKSMKKSSTLITSYDESSNLVNSPGHPTVVRDSDSRILVPRTISDMKTYKVGKSIHSEMRPSLYQLDNQEGDRGSVHKKSKLEVGKRNANSKLWKDISFFNQKVPYTKVYYSKDGFQCPNEAELYSYVIEIDINKTYPGTATPILSCQLGDWINNSANIKLVSSTGSHRLIYDQVLFDSFSQNSAGELFDSLVYHGPTNNFVEQNFNVSFSTPDLIIFRNPTIIMIPEKFRLKSSHALEYCEPNSDSLAVVIDQPFACQHFLTTAFVTIYTCNHTTPLVTVSQNLSKVKRSKIKKLFKSMKSTKSHRQQFYCVQDEPKPDKSNKFLKTIFLLEFKTKMMRFIKKCKLNRLSDTDKSPMTSNCLNVISNDNDSTYLTDTFNYDFHEDKLPETMNISKCNLWTRSCCDLHIQTQTKLRELCLRKMRKRSFSEPLIESSFLIKTESNQLYKTTSLTLTEIPTSGLSFLCFEVLEKMDRKLGKNPHLLEQLTAKKIMSNVDIWSQSSKDTMKLIGRALQYLHGNRLQDSRQSNKTLDSVSSIKTCSADCMESLTSLRQQIIRPVVSTDTVISAYNKYIS